MEAKLLTKPDWAPAKKLWKEAFSDSDAFIDSYFDSEDNTSRALGYMEEGQMMSQLFMIPFCVNLKGHNYQTDFLSGCATAVVARKRDMMRNLIRAAFADMQERGIAITMLQPFLHSFYEKFEYQTIAYVDRYETEKCEKKVLEDVTIATCIEEVPIREMRRAYEKYTREFDAYFVRSTARFDTWLHMLFSDGGRVVYTRYGNEFSYAMYYENDGVAEVFELVAFCDVALQLLIKACGTATFFLPKGRETKGLCPTKEEPFTMMRILDPVAVLEKQKFPEDSMFVLCVEDHFLEQIYNLEVKSTKKGTDVQACEGAYDFKVNIAQLSALVAGAGDTAQQLGMEAYFKQGKSCFFETY